MLRRQRCRKLYKDLINQINQIDVSRAEPNPSCHELSSTAVQTCPGKNPDRFCPHKAKWTTVKFRQLFVKMNFPALVICWMDSVRIDIS